MNKYEKQIIKADKKHKDLINELVEKSIEYTRKSIVTKREVVERELAEFLHEKICNSDHTEYCDWFYDNGDWTMHSRKKYLNMAIKMLKVSNKETILNIIDCI